MERISIYLDGIGSLLLEYDADDDNFDVHNVYSTTKIPGKAIKHLLSDEAIEIIEDLINKELNEREYDKHMEREI